MRRINSIQRRSGIELIKIIAIFLIITSHVVQTLAEKGNAFISFDDYWINISAATSDIKILILAMLRYSGEIGNTIFFICSAWFLLDNDKFNKKKSLLMIMDVWLISIIILSAVLVAEHGHLDKTLIISSLFPLLFENNWYISCYLIFYAFHPILNFIIRSLGQKSLLRVNMTGLILYPGLAFLLRPFVHIYGAGTDFFFSRLIAWSLIYCVIGYLKRYNMALLNNRKFRMRTVAFGFFGTYGLIVLTDLLDIMTGKQRYALQIWNQPFNPFIFALAFGLFLLAANTDFKNMTINKISSLSLYIYVIHENLLLRTLYRPLLWQYIYSVYGYHHVLAWVFILVTAIFIASMIISFIYKQTLHKAVKWLCGKLYTPLATKWKQLEEKLL